MNESTNKQTNEWMNERISKEMIVWIYLKMNGQTNEWMNLGHLQEQEYVQW